MPVISFEFRRVQRCASDHGAARSFPKCLNMLGAIWSLSGGQTGSIVTRPGRGGNQISSQARWRCVRHEVGKENRNVSGDDGVEEEEPESKRGLGGECKEVVVLRAGVVLMVRGASGLVVPLASPSVAGICISPSRTPAQRISWRTR